jgi:hypothetical protein
MKEGHERSHPLWNHHRQLLAGKLDDEEEEILMKMTSIQNELMRTVDTKGRDEEEISFHRAAEQEMAL